MGPGNDQVACSAPCTDPSQTASQQGGGAGHCVLLETNGSRNYLPPVILSGKPRCVPCSRACPRCPRHHTPIGRRRTLPFETLGTGVDANWTLRRAPSILSLCGDPYVCRRGGEEEAAALAAAGVPFEIVPGVSRAIAVPAAAGIPVTHRGVSESVVITTGHDAGTRARDWAALARSGTLVFLLGAQTLPQIVAHLLAGCAPDTPAAAITWGTRAAHGRPVSATLAELPECVEREAIAAPVTIVIGQVVALRTVPYPHHPHLKGTR